jgi:HME family heavy-metal exporter
LQSFTVVTDRPYVPFDAALVAQASLERLTPVLMAALAAGVALLPLLIDAATPGKEILHPVAITISGGLISATALDAFITPILLLRFGNKAIERLRGADRSVAKPSGPITSPPSYY